MLIITAVIACRAKTPICGKADIDAERLCLFVRQHNADFPIEIARAYVEKGRLYGIRFDIAFCQAIIETGWFKFTGGTAVDIKQNNFCGLGVTRLGRRGHEFATVEEGVTAQMQHLYAYACRHKIPEGERLLDPRFALVRRGSAKHWEDLSGRWAANKNYGNDIMKLFARLKKFKPSKKQKQALLAESESADSLYLTQGRFD